MLKVTYGLEGMFIPFVYQYLMLQQDPLSRSFHTCEASPKSRLKCSGHFLTMPGSKSELISKFSALLGRKSDLSEVSCTVGDRLY